MRRSQRVHSRTLGRFFTSSPLPFAALTPSTLVVVSVGAVRERVGSLTGRSTGETGGECGMLGPCWNGGVRGMEGEGGESGSSKSVSIARSSAPIERAVERDEREYEDADDTVRAGGGTLALGEDGEAKEEEEEEAAEPRPLGLELAAEEARTVLREGNRTWESSGRRRTAESDFEGRRTGERGERGSSSSYARPLNSLELGESGSVASFSTSASDSSTIALDSCRKESGESSVESLFLYFSKNGSLAVGVGELDTEVMASGVKIRGVTGDLLTGIGEPGALNS